MAKRLKLTPDFKRDIISKFTESLDKVNVFDGKISFNQSFSCNEKATVWFTPGAYTKMIALIHSVDGEVGWHGITSRMDTDGNDYLVSDILVYPQMVTGGTVETDQEKYNQWMMTLEDDEYNNMHFHGHSHSNMGAFFSSTDNEHVSALVDQLEDDMFYIFMVWNKKFQFVAKIYDMEKSILFETADVSVKMQDETDGLTEFLIGAAKLIEKGTLYSANKNTGANPGGTKPVSNTAAPAATGTQKPGANVTPLQTRPKTTIGNGWQGRNFSGYPNYEDDPYGAYCH